MKKILIVSILVSLFASCGHMGGHKNHDHCKGGCAAEESSKADVKKDKKECEECKKAS